MASEGRRPQQMLAPRWFQQSSGVLGAAATLVTAFPSAPLQARIADLRSSHSGSLCPCGIQRSLCDLCKGIKCGGRGDCGKGIGESGRKKRRCSLCSSRRRSAAAVAEAAEAVEAVEAAAAAVARPGVEVEEAAAGEAKAEPEPEP